MTTKGPESRGARQRWGPDPEGRSLSVLGVERWDGSLLEQVREAEKGLGVPVQAVRGDRVLSWEHLLAAAWHAQRALRAGRSRLQDPGVAFVCFLSAKRQIAQAIDELGVPLGSPGDVPVLLVALGAVDEEGFADHVHSVGLAPVPVRRASTTVMGASAKVYWNGRLGLDEDATNEMRRDRLLAKMALVSLEA